MLRWRAARPGELSKIFLHGSFFFEPAYGLLENLRCSSVRRRHDVIVHPFAFASCGYDARAAQVRQVARNLWLRTAKDLHEVADTDFPIGHEIQEPEPRVVSQCLEEALHVKRLLRHTYVYALTDARTRNRFA